MFMEFTISEGIITTLLITITLMIMLLLLLYYK